MDSKIILKQLSSLDKIFLDDVYTQKQEIEKISALCGERVSYQILYIGDSRAEMSFAVEANEKIKVTVRKVGNVPCAMPAYPNDHDGYYLRTNPGLYPDVLYPVTTDNVFVYSNGCHSLFITCEIGEDLSSGSYPVSISFTNKETEEKITKTLTINVLPGKLPPQDIIYTQWFHADCIATHYKYEVFSEEHWDMLERFIKMAAFCGINMILTPVFTPPLDTQVGDERPTVQLVDVFFKNGEYSFDFKRLKRWIDICGKYGIKRFEISHFFTQWGTGCTPKIEAETENGKEKIFGWHVSALSEKYREFLSVFVPQLIVFLKKEGVYENARFHVSDEPNYEKDFEIYKKEYEMLSKLVPKEKIMDAMSHYEYYEAGLSHCPVVVTSAVESFFKRGIKNIWAYYCCVPAADNYSNHFIAMPSQRNRIIGFQLFYYGIGGFLHWGYNFYYSRLSMRKINPFLETDADEGFPSGDAFIVYPGEDGPLESLRSVVFYEALQDYRACRLLEGYIGKEEVNKIISPDETLTFNTYPQEPDAVLKIRERINRKLEEVMK